MGNRNQKVPPPYTTQAAEPGAKPSDSSFPDWVRNDIRRKESTPQPDYSTGSGSGINNG
jgi:hypothetical protein